jgi:hypothetical protein
MAEGAQWQVFGSGSSLGKSGSERGVILRDEEFDSLARITLEQTATRFASTCGMFGWMVHTRFFAARATAESELDRMKSDLQQIVSGLPVDLNDHEAIQRVTIAINEFIERYPT